MALTELEECYLELYIACLNYQINEIKEGKIFKRRIKVSEQEIKIIKYLYTQGIRIPQIASSLALSERIIYKYIKKLKIQGDKNNVNNDNNCDGIVFTISSPYS